MQKLDDIIRFPIIVSILFIIIFVNFSGCTGSNIQNSTNTSNTSNQVSTGNIQGYVFDKNMNNVSFARITLWQNGQIVNVLGNPYITKGYSDIYSFNVPYGVYTISAEKHDAAGNVHQWATKVSVDMATVDTLIAIPDLVIAVPMGSSPKQDTWSEPPIYNSVYDNPPFSCIFGIASYADGVGIPNATVYLYMGDGKLYVSADNPQQTISRPEVASVGTFRFWRLPFGQYLVTIKKPAWSGHEASEASVSVNATKGVEFIKITLP